MFFSFFDKAIGRWLATLLSSLLITRPSCQKSNYYRSGPLKIKLLKLNYCRLNYCLLISSVKKKRNSVKKKKNNNLISEKSLNLGVIVEENWYRKSQICLNFLFLIVDQSLLWPVMYRIRWQPYKLLTTQVINHIGH